MGDTAIGEVVMGEVDGPATGYSSSREIEFDGMRGRGRIPDDEMDLPLPLPLPLPLLPGCLPSFRELTAVGSIG